jgi:hypothetical protein
MAVPECELFCHSLSAHLQQLYTGLWELYRSGEITLRQHVLRRKEMDFRNGAQHLADASHAHADLVVNRHSRLHFDTHDAEELAIGELDQCDFYFKRSFSRAYVDRLPLAQRRKVFPLGLNYRVYPNEIDHFALRRNLFLGVGFREKLSKFRQALDNKNHLRFVPRLRDMESPPNYEAIPRVLFLARAHDPEDHPDRDPDKVRERRDLNEARADYVRLLKRTLADRFYGGLQRDEFSVCHYPDVVVPDPHMTTQREYLRTMKQYPICIATTGLHGSIGWKFGEYVACARAVLSEPLLFDLPGAFLEGKNYLQFKSPQECVEMAQELIENKELRCALMSNNANYYKNHLRPDAYVRNVLVTAMKY